jgi:hypothetical protein
MGVGGERLVGRQRATVAGEHITDPPLRDRHQGLDMEAVLERHEEMQAAPQHVGLEARFALHSDQTALDGALETPKFFHHGDPIVADVADHAGRADKRRREHDDQRRTDHRPERH